MILGAVKNRKSLTPAMGVPTSQGMHAMRRGGARREVSDRVTLHGAAGEQFDGWALNVSRGGVRVILEEKVALGGEFRVTVGDADNGGTSSRGRIVWVQEEPDGVIAGVEFTDYSGMHSSVPPPWSPPPKAGSGSEPPV